jgi:hypothetical protein
MNHSPEQLALALQQIKTIQQPSIFVDVNTHEQAITHQIQQILAEYFPPLPKVPHKTFLRPSTWEHIQQRRELKQLKNTTQNNINKQIMRITFALWSTKGKVTKTVTTAQNKLRHNNIQQAQAEFHYHKLSNAILTQTTEDKQKAIDKTISKVAEARDTKELFHALKPFRNNTSKRAKTKITTLNHTLHNQDNHPIHNKEEVALAWQQHFATLEKGSTGPLLELLTQCLTNQKSNTNQHLSTVFTHHNFMTLTQLEQTILRLTRNKAFGEDLLPTELLQQNPTLFAQLLLPLHFKVTATITEPITYKGGEMISIPKKHDHTQTFQCNNARGILLLGINAKLFHSHLRKITYQNLKHTFQTTQFGGMPHLETTYATHILRTFYTQQQPTSVLFVDIKAAFYSVIRDFLPGHQNNKLTPKDFTTQLIHNIRTQQHNIKRNNQNQHLLQLLHMVKSLNKLQQLRLLFQDCVLLQMYMGPRQLL